MNRSAVPISGKHTTRALSVAALVVVMLMWSLCYPLISVGLAEAPPFFFAATRALLAGGLLLATGLALRRPLPRGGREWAWTALAGLGATSLGFFGMFFAGGLIPPGIASVLANTQPLIAAGLAAVVLGETLAVLQWLGLGLGLAGVTVAALAAPGSVAGASAVGSAFVILGATGVAVGNLGIKRLAGRTDPLMTMGLQLLLGAIPLALLAVTTERAPHFSGRYVLVLLILAAAGTALPFALWSIALKHLKLGVANTFTFLTPVFGMAIGIIWFGEHLTAAGGVGGVLILVGLIVANWVSTPNDLLGDGRAI